MADEVTVSTPGGTAPARTASQASEGPGADRPVDTPADSVAEAGTPPLASQWPTVPDDALVTPPNRESLPGQPGYNGEAASAPVTS